MISGILAIDKPLGWTSHDVVARVRRVTGQRQVGHAGTLDPLATGVLVLVLGQATRLSAYLMQSSKTYCAEIVLGVTTATDDAEAPSRCIMPCTVSPAEVERCLAGFVGTIDQVPPAYAAVKQGGEKLYVLARKGVDVQPAPRVVTIRALELMVWHPPRLRVRVHCDAGAYIRSLARDLGTALGTGAYLHALRRVASGGISVRQCHELEELNSREAVERVLLPPDRAVLGLPAAVLSDAGVASVRHGRLAELAAAPGCTVRLYDARGELVALGEGTGPRVKPVRVFGG